MLLKFSEKYVSAYVIKIQVILQCVYIINGKDICFCAFGFSVVYTLELFLRTMTSNTNKLCRTLVRFVHSNSYGVKFLKF